MIIRSYNELAKMFAENKDFVKINESVKAFWTFNSEKNETGIGIYIDGKCVITLFKDNQFQIVLWGALNIFSFLEWSNMTIINYDSSIVGRVYYSNFL